MTPEQLAASDMQYEGSLSALPLYDLKLAEGKTKIIWAADEKPGLVRIESKDDITAGDGARRDILPGKGILATTTTVNVFKLLNSKDIATHFVSQDSDNSFLARRAEMIPIECVARGMAAGSYLMRNPESKEGALLPSIPVEFYLKDDLRHDPLMEYDESNGQVLLYNPKDPVATREPIDQMTLDELGVTAEELGMMRNRARHVFATVEVAWGEQNVDLVDMKMEFGKDAEKKLIVADVIDNDSWRIWPGGDKTKMLDKQLYRNGEDLSLVLASFQQAAEMTELFAAHK